MALKKYTDTMVDGGNRQDYSKLISNAILDGKSADYVQSLYDSRLGMINSDPSLEKYRNDDIMKTAQEYINKNSTANKAMEEMKGLYSGDNSMYAKALRESNKITDAEVEKAVGELESQKTATNQSYSDLFKQLYQDKKSTEKNLNQQLAHQGITGGMSETTRLGIDTSYADALRRGEQERVKGIYDLDRAITDTRLSGDIAKAQNAMTANQNAMSGYASYLQSVINRADTESAIEREQAANNKTYAYNLVTSMLQNGTMPDAKTLDVAGISAADAQAMINYYNTAKEESNVANNKTYAYNLVTSMLQNGTMPDDNSLALSGISKADAQAMINYYNSAKEESNVANNKNTAYNTAWAMLQMGVMPSNEVLASAGISTADAQSVVNAVKTQQSYNTTSSGTQAGKMSLSTAQTLATQGILTPEVRQTLREGGYTDDIINRAYFIDFEDIKSDIDEFDLADASGGIAQSDFENIIKIAYPDVDESVLNSMGYHLVDRYSDASEMTPKAQNFYGQFIRAISQNPNNQNVINTYSNTLRALAERGEVTTTDLNTISYLVNAFLSGGINE